MWPIFCSGVPALFDKDHVKQTLLTIFVVFFTVSIFSIDFCLMVFFWDVFFIGWWWTVEEIFFLQSKALKLRVGTNKKLHSILFFKNSLICALVILAIPSIMAGNLNPHWKYFPPWIFEKSRIATVLPRKQLSEYYSNSSAKSH